MASFSFECLLRSDKYLIFWHCILFLPVPGSSGYHPSFLTVGKYDQYHTLYYPINLPDRSAHQNTYICLSAYNINIIYHFLTGVLHASQDLCIKFLSIPALPFYIFCTDLTESFFLIPSFYFPAFLSPSQQRLFLAFLP